MVYSKSRSNRLFISLKLAIQCPCHYLIACSSLSCLKQLMSTKLIRSNCHQTPLLDPFNQPFAFLYMDQKFIFRLPSYTFDQSSSHLRVCCVPQHFLRYRTMNSIGPSTSIEHRKELHEFGVTQTSDKPPQNATKRNQAFVGKFRSCFGCAPIRLRMMSYSVS